MFLRSCCSGPEKNRQPEKVHPTLPADEEGSGASAGPFWSNILEGSDAGGEKMLKALSEHKTRAQGIVGTFVKRAVSPTPGVGGLKVLVLCGKDAAMQAKLILEHDLASVMLQIEGRERRLLLRKVRRVTRGITISAPEEDAGEDEEDEEEEELDDEEAEKPKKVMQKKKRPDEATKRPPETRCATIELDSGAGVAVGLSNQEARDEFALCMTLLADAARGETFELSQIDE